MGLSNGIQDSDWDAPYQMVYGKSCHLPMELELKSMWAVKKLNLDFSKAGEERLLHLNEIEEFRIQAFESSRMYKERMKVIHDKYLKKKNFHVGDRVLYFSNRLSLFPGKLRSKWSGPFEIVSIKLGGTYELRNEDGSTFVMNGKNLKAYLAHEDKQTVLYISFADQ